MKTEIQTLIEQRPHLRDPLEFYASWQRFRQQVGQLQAEQGRASDSDGSGAYSPETAQSLVELFADTFDLPARNLDPIRAALEAGRLDFMRFPLEEIPDLPLPGGDDELAAILYLLSKPYFQALRKSCLLDGQRWEDGRCPLCSAKPAIASVTDDPQRNLHCSWCGTSGAYRFTGCPNCGTTEAAQLNTLIPENDKGFRILTCDGCQTYVKIVEKPVLDGMSVDLADLASLPLDIVAQEKGYSRRTPNPIGLKKIQ